MGLCNKNIKGNCLGSSPYFLIALIVLSSCVTVGDTKKDEELKTSVEELRLASANTAQSIEELKAENERLKGEIEKLTFTIRQGQEAVDVRLLEIETKLNSKDNKKPVAAGVEEQINDKSQDLVSMDIDKRYKTARKFHEERKFDEAEKFYSSIIGSPSKWYEERAMYYLGIMYHDKDEHEKSVVALQDFVDKYPGSRNLPSAIYMQGESLMTMNKPDEAKLFFEDLISRFPKSKEAGDAKKRLSK